MQDNAFLLCLELLKEYKTLRAIVTLFFSNFLQLSSDGTFIPSLLYLIITGLTFC